VTRQLMKQQPKIPPTAVPKDGSALHKFAQLPVPTVGRRSDRGDVGTHVPATLPQIGVSSAMPPLVSSPHGAPVNPLMRTATPPPSQRADMRAVAVGTGTTVDLQVQQANSTAKALTQVVQHLEDLRRRGDDGRDHTAGTLASLRGQPKRIVYLALGCDTFDVKICQGSGS
jgi:hypothetical protein